MYISTIGYTRRFMCCHRDLPCSTRNPITVTERKQPNSRILDPKTDRPQNVLLIKIPDRRFSQPFQICKNLTLPNNYHQVLYDFYFVCQYLASYNWHDYCGVVQLLLHFSQLSNWKLSYLAYIWFSSNFIVGDSI